MTRQAQRPSALIAGIAYLAMTVIALTTMFDPDAFGPLPPASETWPQEYVGALRSHLLGQIAIVALDVVIAVALYGLFRRAARGLALAMAASRLIYAAGFALALTHLGSTYELAQNATAEVASVMAAEAAFARYRMVWDIAFYLFAAHLVLLGLLLWNGTVLRRVLGALLVIAGLGYAIDSTLALAVPQSTVRVAPVTFLGEMTLMLWLLLAAGRAEAPAR